MVVVLSLHPVSATEIAIKARFLNNIGKDTRATMPEYSTREAMESVILGDAIYDWCHYLKV